MLHFSIIESSKDRYYANDLCGAPRKSSGKTRKSSTPIKDKHTCISDLTPINEVTLFSNGERGWGDWAKGDIGSSFISSSI